MKGNIFLYYLFPSKSKQVKQLNVEEIRDIRVFTPVDYLMPLLLAWCLQNLRVILASWHTYLPTPFCPTLINLVAGNDLLDIFIRIPLTLTFQKIDIYILIRRRKDE